ncbi:hypothetical protein B6264_29990 (plasmid) [Kitasatospora aureofaciens]|nr:hypothetical protein B6264_29990 [Kitasatospora aureofaciens]
MTATVRRPLSRPQPAPAPPPCRPGAGQVARDRADDEVVPTTWSTAHARPSSAHHALQPQRAPAPHPQAGPDQTRPILHPPLAP